jgi:hypothetical protein
LPSSASSPAGSAIGSAHDLIPGQTREEPNTAFEALTADSCSPCVKDSYAVAALPLASLRSATFGPTVANMMSRGGEIRIEVVRAYPLGKPSQQVLAMRATLSIKTGDGQIIARHERAPRRGGCRGFRRGGRQHGEDRRAAARPKSRSRTSPRW